jgi:hypothetical protein
MNAPASRTLAAAALLALLVPLAGVAAAGVPNPAQSSLDGDLMLGNARGLAILPGMPFVRPTIADGYRVVVRDLNGVPVGGSVVTMEFAGSGIRPHATQSGGQIAGCPGFTITKVADAAGTAIFFPATVGLNSSPSPNVVIRADGVILGSIRFRSVDLAPAVSGALSAMDLADMNEFRRRFLSLAPYSNTDPACDFATEGISTGLVDVADFNVFRTEYLCGIGGAPAPCQQTQCP